MFTVLEQQCDPPPPPTTRTRPQWLSPSTIQLMDTRATLRRDPAHCRRRARTLTRQVKAAIKADRLQRAASAAAEIGTHLTSNNYQQAWNVCKRWYRPASSRPPTPSRQDLEATSRNFQALYTPEAPSPPGPPLHALINPFPVNDNTPTEAEIKAAVHRIKSNRATGHSSFRAEDFKEWYREAFPQELNPLPNPVPAPATHRWQALVELIQLI